MSRKEELEVIIAELLYKSKQLASEAEDVSFKQIVDKKSRIALVITHNAELERYYNEYVEVTKPKAFG